jgi:hypothetical protein
MGELLWRHPHPVIAGAPCTTHAILLEQNGYSELALRVTADSGMASVRSTVGAGQARPSFLAELNRSLRLVYDGGDSALGMLTDADIDGFVRTELLSDTRECPTAVLSPLEDGGYVVSPADLAEEFLGLAHLYVIDRHPATFRLSDSLGDRRLSCYWGALRIYMPGFSCADRPEDHPLLMSERLEDPVIRADILGKLGRFAGTRVRMPAGIAARRSNLVAEAAAPATAPIAEPEKRTTQPSDTPAPAIAEAREAITMAPPASLANELSGALQPIFTLLGSQLTVLAGTIDQLVEMNASLADEIARLRTTTAVRATSTTSLERRIAGLEQLLRQSPQAPSSEPLEGSVEQDDDRGTGDAAEGGDNSQTLVDILRQAATAHSDALLVLDAAERAAADSPYEDIDRLDSVLDAMASIARRRQEGALGTSLRVAFREIGIEYRGGISPATSARHQQQYSVRDAEGNDFDCREHIVLGTSYDPRYCLRIYFTSKAPVEPRFVIGHVGRHFDVASTT